MLNNSRLVTAFVAVSVATGACLITVGAARREKNLAGAANRSCDKSILDTCVTTLMVFGRRDVYLPKNYKEMVPHCQEEFDAEDCIKNFARKCLPPFERQVAGMLILGAGQVLRKRCGVDGTKEYLSHYECIKRVLPKLHDAMDQLIYSLMLISAKKDNDIKVPASCCSFARFQDYANRLVRSGCSAFDKDAVDYIGVKMIKGYVGDVLDLSCQGYELGSSSGKCAKIKIPDGGYEWRDNNLVKLNNATSELPAKKPNSVVIPFLDIFTNL